MNKLKFAHLADLHIGGYREKKLTDLNLKTFKLAIKKVIESKVDFCLFAGDIFNNALPSLELVEQVVIELIKLKKANIPLYVIGGSHDYSNSGKSFINLLDKSGVFTDVAKWKFVDKNSVELIPTINDKLNISLCGILGKKKGLDKNIYKNLTQHSIKEDYFNIFMFHATLDDIKPDFLKAVKSEITSNFLPKGFNYYAAGHVHTHIESNYDKGQLSFPGPLFPNNFSELKRETPIFNLCEYNFETKKTKIEKIYLNTFKKEYVKIELNKENPLQAKEKILKKLEKIDVKDKIILLEISGIVEGKIKDIELNKIIFDLYQRGSFHVLKNTYKLTSAKIENLELIDHKNFEDIEYEILKKEIHDQDKLNLIKSLLNLDLEKKEDEKVLQYETRVKQAIDESLKS